MQHDFILLDRSGSMASLWDEAIGSVNSYVKKLADDNVDTGVTLAVFDLDIGKLCFDIVRDRIIPSTWKPVSNADAHPRGGTPLSDAVGKIVSLAEMGNYDKVAMIIMTDGEENSSRELSVQQAKELLDRCRDKGWQVIFLGANFDNAHQAASYGTVAAQSVNMAAGKLRASTTVLGSKRGSYGATGQSMTFTNEEKADLATPKATS
jgi:hypothetical protein